MQGLVRLITFSPPTFCRIQFCVPQFTLTKRAKTLVNTALGDAPASVARSLLIQSANVFASRILEWLKLLPLLNPDLPRRAVRI